MDHPALLALAARVHAGGGDMARAESLRHEALRELNPEADLIRYACVLGKLARTQWSLNRGAEGVATAERALAMLPRWRRQRTGVAARLARPRALSPRALSRGDRGWPGGAGAGRESGDTDSESEVLNTLGMAGVALGDVDEGVACLQRALQLAHEAGDQDGCAYVYANLADMLNIAGRTADALATAQEGLAAIPGRLRDNYDWLTLTVSELGFESGDWGLARSHSYPRMPGWWDASSSTPCCARPSRRSERAISARGPGARGRATARGRVVGAAVDRVVRDPVGGFCAAEASSSRRARRCPMRLTGSSCAPMT